MQDKTPPPSQALAPSSPSPKELAKEESPAFESAMAGEIVPGSKVRVWHAALVAGAIAAIGALVCVSYRVRGRRASPSVQVKKASAEGQEMEIA